MKQFCLIFMLMLCITNQICTNSLQKYALGFFYGCIGQQFAQLGDIQKAQPTAYGTLSGATISAIACGMAPTYLPPNKQITINKFKSAMTAYAILRAHDYYARWKKDTPTGL